MDGAVLSDMAEGRCMAPKDPRPMVTTFMCVYPKGHDGNHSWQDAADHRRERMKREGWT
jgi:DNA mismatch repair protein MutH